MAASAGTEIGKAYVQIVPTAKGIKGAIQKGMGGEADLAGEDAGKRMAGKIKGMLVKAGIGAALWKTLNTGAELQQNLGGSEAVFGEYYASIQKTAADAYKNMGLSQSDYLAAANKMGSLFQGAGLDQQKALELTTEAMQRAADVASVMGIDQQMAMESIAGAAKGNFTMMDNLGVAMDATTLKAYALEKGINFDWNTADNAEKAELAMKMFMDRTAQYEGNFARESEETFSGSISAMKAAAQNLMGNLMLGQSVSESMKTLVETAVVFLGNNLVPAIGRILGSIPTMITTLLEPGLFSELGNMLNDLASRMPAMLMVFMNGLRSFSETLRSRAGDFINVGLAFIKKIAEGIIQNIPVFINTVPTILSNFAGVINDNAPKIFETAASILKSLAVGLVKAIPLLIQNLPQILKAIWDVFTAFQWMNIGKTIMTNIGKGIKATAGALKNNVKSIVVAIGTTMKQGFVSAKNAIVSIFNSIKNAIRTRLNEAKSIVSGIISRIKGLFPFHLGKILALKIPKISVSGGKAPWGIGGIGTPPSFHVNWMAKGGIVDSPMLAGVGEAGPEAIMPLDRLEEFTRIDYDRLAAALVKALSSVDLTSTVEVDGREVARSTAPFMRQELDRIDKRNNRKLGYV